MNRTRVRRRRLRVLLSLAVVGSLSAVPVGRGIFGQGTVPVASHSYVVRSGDTLWSIASGLSPGEDPRPFVDAIAEANHVDAGALIPGRTLLIPATS